MRREAHEVSRYRITYQAIHENRTIESRFGRRKDALIAARSLRGQLARYGGDPTSVRMYERQEIVTDWVEVV